MLLLHVLIIYFAIMKFITCGKMQSVIKLYEDLGEDFCAVLSGNRRVSKLKGNGMVHLFHQKTNRNQLMRAETSLITFRTMTDPPPTIGADNNDLNQFTYLTELRGAQLFINKSSVHLLSPLLLQRNHCNLRQTSDFMQTAVNAFAIILWGGLGDIRNLPRDYVLRSVRAIAMMTISREKYAAMWNVVLGNQKSSTITIETLQKYRPLFKYLSGKQIARLNLTDERIVSYIGTHPDLNRHQVGVVANKYIKLNKNWSQPKYLNIMNNLLCGIPMIHMRKVAEHTFLQLAHQVFYHIRACDPLQKRFYLSMMTKTQALGKAYSWSARDVSRLGLLMAEVDGRDLAAINPESMSGLNAQVMNMIPAENLIHITEMQYRYIRQKPLNILAKKLKIYHKTVLAGSGYQLSSRTTLSAINIILCLGS